jgi:trans-aconitate methyltransferase
MTAAPHWIEKAGDRRLAAMTTQAEYWNSEAGQIWAREAIRLDPMLKPLGALAMAALQPQMGETVLDIGCGAGATSRALAAGGANVIGVDVSRPLIEAARGVGGGPDYVEADASVWRPQTPADALFSRFGVMFFDDPPAAFANLRACVKPGARLAFVCWGPMSENAWAIEPVAAALPHLTTPPEPPIPGAPGPFAFAAPGRAVEILSQAGWREALATAWRGPYQVGATTDEAIEIMLKIGPLGRLLRDQPDAAPKVRAALDDLIKARAGPNGVAFAASVWIVTARA